ncbi:MAG TPA: hypothetical protein VMT99_00440 [Candidatus Paceibacterota bacterium]|nr:hypothetical protein [Candidatus Paceibacterota bacterium]
MEKKRRLRLIGMLIDLYTLLALVGMCFLFRAHWPVALASIIMAMSCAIKIGGKVGVGVGYGTLMFAGCMGMCFCPFWPDAAKAVALVGGIPALIYACCGLWMSATTREISLIELIQIRKNW